MISIGIDLHVDNSYITALDGDTGEFYDGVRVPNHNQTLKDYFSQFEGQAMKAVVEATTNTFAMVAVLRQVPGLEICVVNPRKMRIIADSVCKNDRIDSETLAEFGLSNLKLPQSFIPAQDAHDLRSQLRTRAAMVQMRTNLKLRVRSLINGEGFFQPPKDLYGKSGRQWLDQLELNPEARSRLESLLRLIAAFDAELKSVDQRLTRRYAKLPLWQEDMKLLQTMPGIGLITSLTILAELGDWKRFDDPGAVSNYAGLIPRVGASNKKCRYATSPSKGPAISAGCWRKPPSSRSNTCPAIELSMTRSPEPAPAERPSPTSPSPEECLKTPGSCSPSGRPSSLRLNLVVQGGEPEVPWA